MIFTSYKTKLISSIDTILEFEKKPIKNDKKLLFYPKTNKKPLVWIQGLNKSFGKKKKLFDLFKDFNLTIYEGDVIGIVGPNGSGKTTLIEMIGQILEPNSGKIVYNLNYKVEPQEQIGIQFQQSSYPIGLSVKDIISFVVDAYKIKIKDSDLNEMIDVFGLTTKLNSFATNLSGGQQQRLNALLAVINQPQLLLLDELTTGLDIVFQKSIITFLKRFIKERNITCLVVSHNIQELQALATRIVLIKHGEIFVDAPYQQIIKKNPDFYAFLKEYI